MIKGFESYKKLSLGIGFLVAVLFISMTLDFVWVNMIVDIRKAIDTGDSGHLVLTSAIWSFMAMIQSVLILNGMLLIVKHFVPVFKNRSRFLSVHTAIYCVMVLLCTYFELLELEAFVTLFAGVVVIYIISYFYKKEQQTKRNLSLSIQVFFAFQWLNVMPLLTKYYFGITDIVGSIKIASIYLGSPSVLNVIGFTFFTALLLSSLITRGLFITHDRNIAIAKESYEKQIALDHIRAKAVENRVYEEIHAITHDLKTPLVTVRGLNSLIAISSDNDKISEYTDRIDGAVTKMTDMISAFLYDSSKQTISSIAIIDSVRAQTPIEDEALKIKYRFEENLPKIHVNKIRVSRAIINIIENAITAQTHYDVKVISISAFTQERDLVIEVVDNGIGISEEQIKKIWEIGYSTKGTTGLGLAFARKVFEDNGGTIEIDSIVNRGTKVTLRLPIAEDDGYEETTKDQDNS